MRDDSDNAQIRGAVREKSLTWGTLTSEKIKDAVDEKQVYETYYAYSGRLDRIQPYQVLAINRGATTRNSFLWLLHRSPGKGRAQRTRLIATAISLKTESAW